MKQDPRNPHPSTLAGRLLMALGRALLRLRYRVRVVGLDEIKARGASGVVFLPNHPAMVDPVIVMTHLYPDFAPRALGDERQVNRPIVRQLAWIFGVRRLPNMEQRGFSGVEGTRRALAETIAGLRRGENLLVYPAGSLAHRRFEEVGATSGVQVIVESAPAVRVVLVRQSGLWGSRTGWGATGSRPRLRPFLLLTLKHLLLNALFFGPRREVLVELAEPEDFPRGADHMVINAYLEHFYNADAPPNTYVPYSFWERGGVRTMPEPHYDSAKVGSAAAAPAVRRAVLDRLAERCGRTRIADTDELARDLGMDSLAIAELVVWLEQEFGASVATPESLVTVGDVMNATVGRSAAAVEVKRPRKAWFAVPRDPAPLQVPPGETITDVFLARAARSPGRVIVADQLAGQRTYRDLVTFILALKPAIENMPGRYIGVMLPASVGALAVYLTCLFAGKTPVMINWTTGSRHLLHSLDLLNVQKVVTARVLVERLSAMGFNLTPLSDRMVFAEDLRRQISLTRKLGAALRSRLSWRALRRAKPTAEAVVLFTSGSESLPKAVPLTHANILTNLRDFHHWGDLFAKDALLGFLPPFHSFGLVETMVLPVCFGLRVVYHPNPTEAAVLARLIEAYRVSFLVGTPTFVESIVRAGGRRRLASLRIAITGAEKCPPALHELLEKRCPQALILEGYGITECSPVVSVTPLAAPVRGSIGKLAASLEAVIVHPETGVMVAPGDVGLLLVRGPSVFPGYLNYDGPSPFVTFRGDPWYRTGDLVRQAPDGTLFFEGRLKRFVKLGGEMISLPAIEAALAPHFEEAGAEGPTLAVEALGPPESPEVVLFTTKNITRQEVNDWLRAAGLSALYNVRHVIKVESIPVLGTGKTDYRALKERHGCSASGAGQPA